MGRYPDKPHTAANNEPNRQRHMVARHAQGLTVRDIADEFGTSKSTAARLLRKRREGAEKKLFPGDDNMDGNL